MNMFFNRLRGLRDQMFDRRMIERDTTYDLSLFYPRALKEAPKLILLYAQDKSLLGRDVEVLLNRDTCEIYLEDEHGNKAARDKESGKLKRYFSCPDCCFAGFRGEFLAHSDKSYLRCPQCDGKVNEVS